MQTDRQTGMHTDGQTGRHTCKQVDLSKRALQGSMLARGLRQDAKLMLRTPSPALTPTEAITNRKHLKHSCSSSKMDSDHRCDLVISTLALRIVAAICPHVGIELHSQGHGQKSSPSF